MDEIARSGRARVTLGTGESGSRPEGHPTYVGDGLTAEGRRSIERENSATMILAEEGYRVRQNPSRDEVAAARQASGDTGRPESQPDYLIEGRVFDCLAPDAETSVRAVWSAVRKKVRKDQTQRVVINLQDWRGDMSALRAQFADWPIARLKEVKAITADGEVAQISLPPATTESMTDGA